MPSIRTSFEKERGVDRDRAMMDLLVIGCFSSADDFKLRFVLQKEYGLDRAMDIDLLFIGCSFSRLYGVDGLVSYWMFLRHMISSG